MEERWRNSCCSEYSSSTVHQYGPASVNCWIFWVAHGLPHPLGQRCQQQLDLLSSHAHRMLYSFGMDPFRCSYRDCRPVLPLSRAKPASHRQPACLHAQVCKQTSATTTACRQPSQTCARFSAYSCPACGNLGCLAPLVSQASTCQFSSQFRAAGLLGGNQHCLKQLPNSGCLVR